MDIISLAVFVIYTLSILLILIYVSPILSAVLLLLVPVSLVYFMPGTMTGFLAIEQFSTIQPVNNFQILLMIWSALIGIIAYSEVFSWYLLRESAKKPSGQDKPGNEHIPGDAPLPLKNKLLDFYHRLRKNMSGEK